MKYIIIFEDGQIYKANELSKDTLKGCHDGVLDVIDITSLQCLVMSDDLEVLAWDEIKAWTY